ncbi:MAG: PAS domain S-box protein [Desulfobacula sp.]|nr:PAS domain S-box protein [Desulfobacula sp.]
MDQTPSDDHYKNTNLALKKQINALEYAKKINYTLFDISNAVNATHNLEQLYKSIYDSLNKLMPLPNFFIAIYNNKTQTINFDYFIDEHDDDFPIIEDLHAPNCLTGEVILAKRPLFLKENMLIERAKNNKIVGTIPKTWLGVPLIIQDIVIGVIAVQHYSNPDYFSHQHLEILISVSEQIAIAIERKQILDALEKKEKTLSLITDNTSSIIAIVDANGIFKFANPAHRFIGYNAQDLSNTSFFDIIHPQDVQPLLEFLEKGIKGKASHITLEFRIKNKSGDFQALKGSFDLIKNEDGLMEKLIFIGEDISKQKKAQEALHESEKRFKLIFDTSPDAIIITDIETGKIFDANKAFTALSGLTKKDLAGKYTTTIGIWKDQKQRSDFISIIKKNGFYENLEAKLIFKGRPVSTLVSSRLLMLKGRQHLLSIIRDISGRKKLEEQLIRRQKMDSIETLVGGIAHDFNNLLSSIMGYLELLNIKGNNLSETQKDHVSNALISSKKAAKLTRQLHALTKPSVKKPSTIDLFKTAQNVFNILEQTCDPLIEKKNELPENQYFVKGYDSELHQALMNLGTNAIRAIETKGVSSGNFIRLFIPDAESSEKFPSPEPAKNYLHLCLQDTGCGMTTKVKNQAFDPMFSTKQMGDQKGQGLGLSMVYNIITKKHDGFIDVETKQGQGTVFHLFLPKAKAPVAKFKKGSQPNDTLGTVLVIDDEDMVRDMAVKALESFGYKTFDAEDGQAGIEIYKKRHQSIDAVLLDIIMPRMSGVETYKQLIKINPRVKVIIASGHITNQEQKKLFVKASAYLDKPYQILDLKEMLHRILN